MDTELKEIKATLQCLVVSSPTEVNVVSLIRDYKRLIGHPLPYEKYGFRNATSFLRAKLSDCFLFSGTPTNPNLTLRVPEKSKYIDNLVQQITLPEDKNIPKRRNVPESAAYHPQRSLQSGSDKKKSGEAKNTNGETPKEPDGGSDKSAKSEAETADNEDPMLKLLQFEALEADVLNILKNYPGGMWFGELMREYEDRHKKSLCSHFDCFYSKNIEELMLVMFDTVSLRRPDEDSEWLVFDASKPIPTRAARPGHQSTASALDPEDALSLVAYDPDVFPEDCVQLEMKSAQPGPFAHVEYALSISVKMAEMYSPTQFWLVRCGEQYSGALETMRSQMREYYEIGEGKSRVLSLPATRVGQYCAIQFQGMWHRARVLRVNDRDLNTEVLLIDHGGLVDTPSRELKPLCLRWGDLPRQAVQARLADLAPVYGNIWPEVSCMRMSKLVQNKSINARVVGIEVETNVLLVQLIVQEQSNRLDVGNELLRLGYARHETDGDAGLDSGEDQAWGWQGVGFFAAKDVKSLEWKPHYIVKQ